MQRIPFVKKKTYSLYTFECNFTSATYSHTKIPSYKQNDWHNLLTSTNFSRVRIFQLKYCIPSVNRQHPLCSFDHNFQKEFRWFSELQFSEFFCFLHVWTLPSVFTGRTSRKSKLNLSHGVDLCCQHQYSKCYPKPEK